MRRAFSLLSVLASACGASGAEQPAPGLWFSQPAENWTDPLPIENSQLTRAVIHSKLGCDCVLRYGSHESELEIEAHKKYGFEGQLRKADGFELRRASPLLPPKAATIAAFQIAGSPKARQLANQ